MTSTALITIVHGRHEHLLAQEQAILASTVQPDHRIIVAMDDDLDIQLPSHRAGKRHMLGQPGQSAGLPLAAARNLGASSAVGLGCELLIFLDVDCLPSKYLVERYRAAAGRSSRCPGALYAGTVTYLDPPPPSGYPINHLESLTNPHPSRPAPAAGQTIRDGNHNLFWSLSFAVAATTWQHLGGFCEEYVGYGGEDTDFAFTARARGTELVWVGGADAYHQFHPTTSPPVAHLVDIVRNARIFHRRWGQWPMEGWLRAFEEHGLITRTPTTIEITTSAGP